MSQVLTQEKEKLHTPQTFFPSVSSTSGREKTVRCSSACKPAAHSSKGAERDVSLFCMARQDRAEDKGWCLDLHGYPQESPAVRQEKCQYKGSPKTLNLLNARSPPQEEWTLSRGAERQPLTGNLLHNLHQKAQGNL